MHEVLVNRLGGLSLPRKSVVRLTDRPDMTLDVYRGRKTTKQQTTTTTFHLNGAGRGWGGRGSNSSTSKEKTMFAYEQIFFSQREGPNLERIRRPEKATRCHESCSLF